MIRPCGNKHTTPRARKSLPDDFFAKTYRIGDNDVRVGRTVLSHCRIVGEVARELVRRSSLALVCPLFPSGAELVAASHDTGKITPTFQQKILVNTSNYKSEEYPMLQGINPDLERNWGGHQGVSQVTLEAAAVGDYIPEIAGQHHGYRPQVALYSADAAVFGGAVWQKARLRLLEQLQGFFKSHWPKITTSEQSRLLAGLTTVADWIGSGPLFDDPSLPWDNLVVQAVDEAGFIPPKYNVGLSFSQVFEGGFTPYPVQEQFIMRACSQGVYILEAPMGTGKTEAALYAAYQLLCKRHACGIYFALPTQLTSNKIYQRFNAFLKTILADDCFHRRALLLHGKAWLQEIELGGEGSPGGSWFNSSKRGLLAPFGVGTLDQALMAAMQVKHGFVRAFGLAGKVVILDEVHTYDAYTGTIIDALVKLLQSLHCTVIILSATLSRNRRSKLLGMDLQENSYPLISGRDVTGQLFEQPVPMPKTAHRRVIVTVNTNTEQAMEEALKRAEMGQQVLWIENTVKEAQQLYLALAARCFELDISCGLIHSRFTMDDRQHREECWVNLFGKAGWEQRAEQGRLLIGTQVLEQSLDIDSDFLVTRFCPTDMLFQRLGRLWRHDNTPRQPTARQEAWILAPLLTDAVQQPLKAFGDSAWVYSPYVLCRSLEVWQACRDVVIPADIRSFIEKTYLSRQEEGLMDTWLYELENGSRHRIGRKALQQLARVTLSEGGTTLPESKAQTRYSEEDTCEVLLLRGMAMQPENRQTLLTLLNGNRASLPWDRKSLSWRQWRRLSARLMGQMVATRYRYAPLPLPMKTLKKLRLQHCFYLGHPEQEEPLLRLALVDETGYLQGYHGAPLLEDEQIRLQYRDDLGYRVITPEE